MRRDKGDKRHTSAISREAGSSSVKGSLANGYTSKTKEQIFRVS